MEHFHAILTLWCITLWINGQALIAFISAVKIAVKVTLFAFVSTVLISMPLHRHEATTDRNLFFFSSLIVNHSPKETRIGGSLSNIWSKKSLQICVVDILKHSVDFPVFLHHNEATLPKFMKVQSLALWPFMKKKRKSYSNPF